MGETGRVQDGSRKHGHEPGPIGSPEGASCMYALSGTFTLELSLSALRFEGLEPYYIYIYIAASFVWLGADSHCPGSYVDGQSPDN